MRIFQVFGLDLKMLVAQLVNFAILAFLLYRFAYKPMLKMLSERTKKIEEGINNADQAEKRLKEISEKEKDVIKEAKREAAKIIEAAKIEADEAHKHMIEKAREEIGAVINKEKEGMRLEKSQVLREIKSEVADLVMMSVEKVLGERNSIATDRRDIERLIANNK